MRRWLQTVADGVHLGPLAHLSMFNSVVVDRPEGTVVIDSGPAWSGKRLARPSRRMVGRYAATTADSTPDEGLSSSNAPRSLAPRHRQLEFVLRVSGGPPGPR